MEVDVDELVLIAAAMKMEDRHHTHESFFLWKALVEMYPETDLLMQVRNKVQEYEKLKGD